MWCPQALTDSKIYVGITAEKSGARYRLDKRRGSMQRRNQGSVAQEHHTSLSQTRGVVVPRLADTCKAHLLTRCNIIWLFCFPGELSAVLGLPHFLEAKTSSA